MYVDLAGLASAAKRPGTGSAKARAVSRTGILIFIGKKVRG
jgi:hypothetical protein